MCMSPRCGAGELEVTKPSKAPMPASCGLLGVDLETLRGFTDQIGRLEKMLLQMKRDKRMQQDPGIPAVRTAEAGSSLTP